MTDHIEAGRFRVLANIADLAVAASKSGRDNIIPMLARSIAVMRQTDSDRTCDKREAQTLLADTLSEINTVWRSINWPRHQIENDRIMLTLSLSR